MSIVDFLSVYTYRSVLVGTSLIGAIAGALGCFAYVRHQSLASDVISHSALPGVLLAFLFSTLGPGAFIHSPLLLVIGAAVTGTAAHLVANIVASRTPLTIDAAMATTLSLFFGTGMLLLQFISKSSLPGKGGIGAFLFGNASTLTKADITSSAVVGGCAILVTLALWKEFSLRAFDPEFCTVLGLNGKAIDAAMFAMLAIATVAGVKAVGLVLMVAFVVTPPAVARQWTRELSSMTLFSALVGAGASSLGAYVSVAFGSLPSGPVTVLVLVGALVVSLLCAPRRGILARMVASSTTRRTFRSSPGQGRKP